MSSDYPSDWNKRRKSVYKRDDYTCQNCGRDGGNTGNVELHAHHVVPKANGGTHEKSNLITVCNECHQSIHGNKTAPSSQPSSASDIQIPSEINDAEDLYKTVQALGQFSDPDGDMYALKQVMAQDIYWAHQHEDSISYSIKSDILNTKSTLSNTNFTHSDREVQETIRSHIPELIECLGLLIEYVNGIKKYHKLTKSIRCPSCSSMQDASSQFCGDCGEELPIIWNCPKCGDNLDTINNEFCTSCGEPVPDFPENQLQELEEIKQSCIETWNKYDAKLTESLKEILTVHPRLHT